MDRYYIFKLAISSIYREIIDIRMYFWEKSFLCNSFMISNIIHFILILLFSNRRLHLPRVDCSLPFLVVIFTALTRTSRIIDIMMAIPGSFLTAMEILPLCLPIDFYHSNFIITCQFLNYSLS